MIYISNNLGSLHRYQQVRNSLSGDQGDQEGRKSRNAAGSPPKGNKKKILGDFIKRSWTVIPHSTKNTFLAQKEEQSHKSRKSKDVERWQMFFFFLIKRKRKKRRRRSAVSEQLSRKGFSGAGGSHYGPQPGWRWPATGTF